MIYNLRILTVYIVDLFFHESLHLLWIATTRGWDARRGPHARWNGAVNAGGGGGTGGLAHGRAQAGPLDDLMTCRF